MDIDTWILCLQWAYFPIVGIGLFGNFISFLVYTQKHMRKSSIGMLLCALSFVDFFLLILVIPVFTLTKLPIWDSYGEGSSHATFVAYSVNIFYPLCMIAKTLSLYIMVLISLERCLAVCKPLQVHLWCTKGNTLKVLIGVSVFSILFNLSRVFEYRLDLSQGFDKAQLEFTDLNPVRTQWYFLWYYVILSIIFEYLLPFMIMLVANAKIISVMYQKTKERLILTKQQQKEQKITKMLLVVTIFFGICHALSMATKLIESLTSNSTSKEFQLNPIWVLLVSISSLLIIFHAATTFVIYHLFCEKYRNTLQGLIKCKGNDVFTSRAHSLDTKHYKADRPLLQKGDSVFV